jgi:hypothetical protein
LFKAVKAVTDYTTSGITSSPPNFPFKESWTTTLRRWDGEVHVLCSSVLIFAVFESFWSSLGWRLRGLPWGPLGWLDL